MHQLKALWNILLHPLVKYSAWIVIGIAFINEIYGVDHFGNLRPAIITAAAIWLLFIEPLLNIPRIYFVKDTGMFLYVEKGHRISFDFLTRVKSSDNGRPFYGGINQLHISKVSKLDENNSYLVFDNRNSAVAILPCRWWRNDSQPNEKIIFIDANGAEANMSLGSFIANQGHILQTQKELV